jgi:pantetheine-phosphate adenylyltransferase
MIRLETELNKRWNTLWNKMGASGNPDIPFAQLMTFYSEAGRYYHTTSHIKSCLDSFDQVKHMANDPEAVELAIWTHDSIYNPRLKDNEEKSTEWAKQVFSEAQIPSISVDKISRLVMVSKTHTPAADDIDEQMMADIDLVILGSHPIIYDEYKDGIRKEYKQIPFYQFRPGRIKVLGSLADRLEKGDLFHLPYFRYKCEETTRYNLQREISELKAMKVAVDAGSFDPPTNGHLYIIEKAREIFDSLVVAIGQNPTKGRERFTIEERLEMLREITDQMPNVDVTSYPAQLLIKFVQSIDANIIVRGLRDQGDWPGESAMDEYNMGVNSDITTVFIRTPDALSRISSSFVMDLAKYPDGVETVASRVPDEVYKRIVARAS